MICQMCGKDYAPWGNSQGLCKVCWADVNNDPYDRGDDYDRYFAEEEEDEADKDN